MTILVILLCIFNLVMWLLAIVRFRKMFSTDDIVQKTRDELNKMMMEINRNAERNVDLLEDRIQKLKAISAETDRHIEILRGELANTEKSRAFQSRLAGVEQKRKTIPMNPDEDFSLESPVEPVKKPRASTRKKPAPVVQEPVVEPPREQVPEKMVEPPVEKIIEPGDGASPIARPNGHITAYKQIAQKKSSTAQTEKFSREIDDIVRKSSFEIESDDEPTVGQSGPKIIVSPNPIRPMKSKKDQVLELSETGMTVDEIARQLKTTTTEVEFILDMLK